MKIHVAYYKYLWKEKVIFQTTKLGLGCLSFHQPPFPHHSVKLLPIRVAQGVKSKAKSCSLLFSVASTYTPKTSPEEPQNSPLFNGKKLSSRFHRDWVSWKLSLLQKKSNQILGQIFILKIPSNHWIQLAVAKIPPARHITSALMYVCIILHDKVQVVTSLHHPFTCKVFYICTSTLISTNFMFGVLESLETSAS